MIIKVLECFENIREDYDGGENPGPSRGYSDKFLDFLFSDQFTFCVAFPYFDALRSTHSSSIIGHKTKNLYL